MIAVAAGWSGTIEWTQVDLTEGLVDWLLMQVPMQNAFIIGLTVCGALLTAAAQAEDSPGIGGFRSDLWGMEYQEEDAPEGNSEGNVAQGTKSAEADGHVKGVGETGVVGDLVVTQAVALPGTRPALSGQEDQLLVDNLADSIERFGLEDSQIVAESTAPGGVIDAHRDKGNGFMPASNSGSQGPSMVTLLVAIVAGVVVTGALFSGRE